MAQEPLSLHGRRGLKNSLYWCQRYVGRGNVSFGHAVRLAGRVARMTSLQMCPDAMRLSVKRQTSVLVSLFLCLRCVLLWLACIAIFWIAWEWIFSKAIVMVCFISMRCCSSYLVGLVGSSNNPVSRNYDSRSSSHSRFFSRNWLSRAGRYSCHSRRCGSGLLCRMHCRGLFTRPENGSLLHAKPRNQQLAQIVGVVLPAMVIAQFVSLYPQKDRSGS